MKRVIWGIGAWSDGTLAGDAYRPLVTTVWVEFSFDKQGKVVHVSPWPLYGWSVTTVAKLAEAALTDLNNTIPAWRNQLLENGMNA